MDFLDPAKKRVQKIRLLVGYVFITILILLAATVLLYQAYGYGFGKNGQVIQNGLVFVNSVPSGADIYLSGASAGAKTNARLVLPAGQYTLKLQLNGYRDWVRSLGVEGGSVERFDYPFLFPAKLATTTYANAPGLVAQSLDRRWLLVAQTGSFTDFDLYDLSNHTQPATTISLPAGLLTAPPAGGTQSWQLVAWASDNRHVLLLHNYTGGSEYILLDRQTPAASLNLTRTLNLSASARLSLSNRRYDYYFVYDSVAATLGSTNLTDTAIAPLLTHVLDFQTYNTGTILYATDAGAPAGKALIELSQNGKNYQLQTVSAGSQYLLDLTDYNGAQYIVLGAAADGRVYVYENPLADLAVSPPQPLVPAAILRVSGPDFEAFSASARFIMVENGSSFAVYDSLNAKTYSYHLNVPIDPGEHAVWMDGNRLILTSAGKLVVFDYDDANQQTLNAAEPDSLPYFDPKYQYLYNLAPAAIAPQVVLDSTALTVPPAP